MRSIHACARTTPALRREIQQSSLSEREMARKYNVSRTTIRKWRHRDSVEDRSYRPRRLVNSLTPAQQWIVAEARKTLLLSLDDLMVFTHEFLSEKTSRSSVYRCLTRHQVADLQAIERQWQEQCGTGLAAKSFKDLEPGTVQIDIKTCPPMVDQSSRYLLIAIDRATRWAYLETGGSRDALCIRGFLHRLIAKTPFQIESILIRNEPELTDQLPLGGESEPTSGHPLAPVCAEQGIKLRLCAAEEPQTKGTIEEFDGQLSELFKTTRFDPSQDLKTTLERYLHIYNQQIPQKALGSRSPIQVLRQWAAESGIISKPM